MAQQECNEVLRPFLEETPTTDDRQSESSTPVPVLDRVIGKIPPVKGGLINEGSLSDSSEPASERDADYETNTANQEDGCETPVTPPVPNLSPVIREIPPDTDGLSSSQSRQNVHTLTNPDGQTGPAKASAPTAEQFDELSKTVQNLSMEVKRLQAQQSSSAPRQKPPDTFVSINISFNSHAKPLIYCGSMESIYFSKLSPIFRNFLKFFPEIGRKFAINESSKSKPVLFSS